MATQNTNFVEFKDSSSDLFFNQSPVRSCSETSVVTVTNTAMTPNENIRLSDYTGALGVGAGLTHYYKMRGKDVDCVGPIVYRSWVVTGTPDATGALYTGPKCGASPLAEIAIEDKWDI